MRAAYFITLILSLGFTQAQAQSPAELEIHPAACIDSLMVIEARPIAFFIHAEWCKYCRNMEHTTFNDPDVIARLNRDYYFVSFDGESKEELVFGGIDFPYIPNGRDNGTHDLAYALGAIDGQVTYPTFTLMDTSFTIYFQHNSFLSAEEMNEVLQFDSKE